MHETIKQPEADIARYVRVRSGDDGIQHICVADNRRSDFKVQSYVAQMQQRHPGKTRVSFLSMHDLAQVEGQGMATAADHSDSQSTVLGYFRAGRIRPAPDHRPGQFRPVLCGNAGAWRAGTAGLHRQERGDGVGLDHLPVDV